MRKLFLKINSIKHCQFCLVIDKVSQILHLWFNFFSFFANLLSHLSSLRISDSLFIYSQWMDNFLLFCYLSSIFHVTCYYQSLLAIFRTNKMHTGQATIEKHNKLEKKRNYPKVIDSPYDMSLCQLITDCQSFIKIKKCKSDSKTKCGKQNWYFYQFCFSFFTQDIFHSPDHI